MNRFSVLIADLSPLLFRFLVFCIFYSNLSAQKRRAKLRRKARVIRAARRIRRMTIKMMMTAMKMTMEQRRKNQKLLHRQSLNFPSEILQRKQLLLTHLQLQLAVARD
jgi:hypothetical protein